MHMSSKKSDMRQEYSADLIKSGVKGKYTKRYRTEGSNVVLIDPDMHQLFPDSASVNKALRAYAQNRSRSAT
jgi:hypothetical protein